MLNTINLLGASKSGKTTIVPILSASGKTDLPFNTPDLDWYIEAFESGGLDLTTASRLCSAYILTNSWYSHLGRHSNLRHRDYHSLQRLKKNISIEDRYKRNDDDREFEKFLRKHDTNKLISIFCSEMTPLIYNEIITNFPIQISSIYCHRSPYSMVGQWLSGNRIERSQSLSRMFKYSSMKNLTRSSLVDQMVVATNNGHMVEVAERFEFFDSKVGEFAISSSEITALKNLLKLQKVSAQYWKEHGLLLNFEKVVTQPKELINSSELLEGLEISSKNLNNAIDFIGLRKIDDVLEKDFSIMRKSLMSITDDQEFVDMVLNEQMEYLSLYFS